ncbi:TlpA family protein disulfide reductase [Chitinophaga sp. NPDC101104]|uniref:TlpA family protein disulfide reductase n=1 Tax=Chitinophaga sp. NPDC101104 TaxID=3390561 RepID=UPI003D07243B
MKITKSKISSLIMLSLLLWHFQLIAFSKKNGDTPTYEDILAISVRINESDKLTVEEKEILSEKYFQMSQEFWVKNPKDKRRFTIFEMMSTEQPTLLHFWKNVSQASVNFEIKSNSDKSYWQSYSAEIDTILLNKWNQFYPIMKAEYLNHVDAENTSVQASKIRINILTSEMKRHLTLSQNIQFRKNGKIDLKPISKIISEATLLSNEDHYELKNLLRNIRFQLISGYDELGFSKIEILEWLKELNANGNVNMNSICSKWITQTISVLNDPLKEFQFKSENGKSVTIDDYKGKILLVDVWSLTCSSCIQRMKFLKELYKKYKTEDFEIISLCINIKPEDPIKIKEVEKNIDGGWETFLLGNPLEEGTIGHKMWNAYGFNGVPQIFLFNKNGELILFNNSLTEGNFEPLLKEKLNTKIN